MQSHAIPNDLEEEEGGRGGWAYWAVGFLLAVEAEGGATAASNIQRLSLQVYIALHCKLTIRCWTPFKHAVVLHKGPQPKALVPLLVIFTGYLINHGSRHLHLRRLGALNGVRKYQKAIKPGLAPAIGHI